MTAVEQRYNCVSLVLPASTQESMRDSGRTISYSWALPKALQLYHPNYCSKTRWEKRVTTATPSLLQANKHQ